MKKFFLFILACYLTTSLILDSVPVVFAATPTPTKAPTPTPTKAPTPTLVIKPTVQPTKPPVINPSITPAPPPSIVVRAATAIINKVKKITLNAQNYLKNYFFPRKKKPLKEKKKNVIKQTRKNSRFVLPSPKVIKRPVILNQ